MSACNNCEVYGRLLDQVKAERDSLMEVCEDETGAIKKLTEERDRLREDLKIIAETTPIPAHIYLVINHAKEALNHKECVKCDQVEGLHNDGNDCNHVYDKSELTAGCVDCAPSEILNHKEG